jgi:oligopeptide transport system ATP-binding protein
MENTEKIIQVKNLKVSFYTDKGRVQVIRDISFDLYKGEVLCIVGESGSGKSVTAKTIMGILPANGRIDGGSINYQKSDLTKVSEEEFHQIRGKKIGMIFQDPLSSLNPIMRVGKQITEAIILNGDKIKRKYNDLILPELIKFENNRTTLLNLLHNAQLSCNNKINASLKSIEQLKTNASITNQSKSIEIQKLRKEISNEKSGLKIELSNIKAKLKKVLKNDYIELKKKKIFARKESINFRNTLLLNHKIKLNDLVTTLRNTKSKSEKIIISKAINQLKEDFINSLKTTRKEAHKQAIQVMKEVGISYPEQRFKQYPFEFSGGMRQRIVIAIALIQNPDILILDEPTTALDVTIQAQILDLISKLKRERNLSCIFITHDLGVVAQMADRIAVMYAGKIVEYGKVEELFYNPKHPYTWALLSSIPDIDSKERLESIPGTPPNLIFPPTGDAFASRSKYALAIDFEKEPPFFKISETHYAASWLLDPRAPQVELPKSILERIIRSRKDKNHDSKNN